MAYCCAQKSLEQNCALTRMTLLITRPLSVCFLFRTSGKQSSWLDYWSPQSRWWCWLWVRRKGAGSQVGEGAEENGATVAGVQGAPWWALRLILQSLSAEGNSEYHEGDLTAVSSQVDGLLWESHGWQPWPQPPLSIKQCEKKYFFNYNFCTYVSSML